MAVPTDERRDTIRLHCSIGASMKTKKTTREVRVINASLTGLAIEMESKIRRKTHVAIHRDQYGGPVVGHVIWCRAPKGSNRFQVGVAYEDDKQMLKDSWLKPALKDLGFTVGRINEKRLLLRVPGRHRRCFLKSFAGDTYSTAELVNLSLGGALVASEVEIPKGLRLKLKTDPIASIQDLIMEAEVKSCKHDRRSRRYLVGLIFTKGDEKLVKKHMSAMMEQC
jgi:PilZ domain